MSARLLAVIAVSLVTGAAGAQVGQPAGPPATAPGPTVTVVNRTDRTITGQPFAVPDGPLEVVFSVAEIAVGGALPMHKHPWPRFAYVESGQLRVHYEEAGLVRVFGPGEAVVEAIDQWHEGEVVGDAPVRLIVVDQVPPGRSNVVSH
jgi:quercetin dioxygenase-like cupin family protein